MKILTLDSETPDLTGKVYDLGWCVHDKTGKIYKEYNALVTEVFTNSKEMVKAFYAHKTFTHYAPMLSNGEVKLTAWETIADQFRADIAEFNVQVIAGYNLGFDINALRRTNEKLGTDYLSPENIKLLDIWQFACEVLLNKSTYKKMAEENGWKTPKGNFQTNAEVAYRFLKQNPEFVEDHTAISDARIEVELLAKCFSRKKKIPYNKLNKSPWRIVNA